KQPWRAVVCGDKVHFYEKKSKAMSNNPLGDIQKVDVGIALAHFDLTLKESGISGDFAVDDPGFSTDNSIEYIVTYEVKH
ncbi:MAG: nitroreductase, partial [Lachnospiraceae bacterium]|nr:nitroreductase [Lachnospiraceae bacterium]